MNIYETAIGRAARYDDRAIPNNTTFQLVTPDIRREDFVKVDYHFPNSTDMLNYSTMYGVGSIKAELDTSYPTFGFIRRNAARTHRVGWTRILSPNAVNKVSAQVNHLQLGFPSLLEYTQSQRYGFAPKELFGNDIRDVGIPRVSWALGWIPDDEEFGMAQFVRWHGTGELMVIIWLDFDFVEVGVLMTYNSMMTSLTISGRMRWWKRTGPIGNDCR